MLVRSKIGAIAVACAALAAAILLGCGGGSSSGGSTSAQPSSQSAATAPERQGTDHEGADPSAPRPQTVAPARCPADSPGCRSATGQIFYVERHDPDGDGDAHFVILDPQGITFQGLTSIDVEVGLRPHPLPGPGDLISAAGPVQTGSFGQDQIHALDLNVAGRP